MAYGLKVINSSNVLQIDDTFMNNALYSKERVTLQKVGSSNYYRATRNAPASLSSTQYNVAVALVNTAHDFYFGVDKGSGGYTIAGCFWSGTATTVDVDVYLFSDSSKAPQDGSKFGLQVFNSSGEATFDSRLKYMKVINYLAPVLPEITWGFANVNEVVELNYTIPSGRKYAISTGSIRSRNAVEIWAYPGEMNWQFWTTSSGFHGGYTLTNGNVKYRYWCYNSINASHSSEPQTYDYIVGFTNALVIDVTGY